MSERGSSAPRTDRARSARAGRRLALASIFEAEFGQHTARDVLDRHLAESGEDPAMRELASSIVDAVVLHRDRIDVAIEQAAPQYPLVSFARMDRSLLRCALGEVLHSATPARVAIAEWVELARTYSGDPMRRLMNGVLGRIASEASAAPARRGTSRPPGPSST